MTKRKNTYNPETGEITLTQPVVSRPFTSGPCVGISQTLAIGTKLKIDVNQLLGTSSTMSLLAIDNIDISGKVSQTFTVSDISKMPKLSEWHIYGNEQQRRFSVKKPDYDPITDPLYYLDVLKSDVTKKNFFRILDKKQYELKDHLGNVRATIGDYKLPFNDATSTRSVAPFFVDEKATMDYYAGGMAISDRSFSSNNSRYGYNAQEKSLEIDGFGNHNTAEFWEMDARILRRWNLDPIPQIAISDFAINRNNPIYYNDPNGDCPNCITAAIGAGIGTLIGGSIEIGTQLYKSGKVNNWKAVGGSALQGGVTGGVAGLTGGLSLFATATALGTANAVGGAINNNIQGKPVTTLSVVTDAITGLAFGAAGKYVSKFIKFESGGSIITSGVTHGTETHWATMTGLAKTLAEKGETVYLNKSINTALGKTIEGVGNWRPDVLSIAKNGVVNITEVVSPSQTAKDILNKVSTIRDALVRSGYKVNTNVLTETGEKVVK